MGGRSSVYLPFILAAALIFCYATVSLPSTFTDVNPIRIASSSSSDGLNHLQSSPHQNPRSTIEAIYQFGDSISDTGNIIHEDPNSFYGNLPYGETYFHKPTGRCSDGLLMIDYFTKFLKLPFLEPYLNKDGDFSHGANFAVAGATAMNCSTLAKDDIKNCPIKSSLLVQLDWFESHLHSICSTVSECRERLAKSLILMGEIGGNDYNWALSQRNSMDEIYKMVPKVVHVIKIAIEKVINRGAIRIIVPGNFPIGCMTIVLNIFKTNDLSMYDELQCLKHFNVFAEFHNKKLQQVIREVQEDHPHVTIVYADYYSALQEIIRNATSLGFDKDVMQIACCDRCGSKGAPACKNPYKRISWDGVHLTQHAYQIMAEWLIKHNPNIFNDNISSVKRLNYSFPLIIFISLVLFICLI